MYSWVGPGRDLPGKMGEIEETVLLPDILPCLALWVFSFLPLISLEFHDNFGERGSKGEKELCVLSTWYMPDSEQGTGGLSSHSNISQPWEVDTNPFTNDELRLGEVSTLTQVSKPVAMRMRIANVCKTLTTCQPCAGHLTCLNCSSS